MYDINSLVYFFLNHRVGHHIHNR